MFCSALFLAYFYWANKLPLAWTRKLVRIRYLAKLLYISSAIGYLIFKGSSIYFVIYHALAKPVHEISQIVKLRQVIQNLKYDAP